MIRNTKPKVNENKETADYHATRIVAAGTTTSRILGVAREQVIAYLFGASAVTDAFVVAFRIPNLLRDLFAEGALSAAFIPTFTDLLKNRGPKAARALYQQIFSWIILVVGGICVLGIFFAPELTQLLAAGFANTPGKLDLTVQLARMMFPFLLFVSLAALAMGALNSLNRFAAPAFAPLWFNLAIIGCAFALAGQVVQPVYALAVGVIVGGFGQWFFQVIFLGREGYPLRWQLKLSPEVIKIFKLLLPAIGGLAAVQINIFIITRVAASLGDGPVAYLNFAFRLIFLPLGIFAVAAATVGLPRFALRVAAGDTAGALARWRDSLRLVWFLVLPAAAVFVFFGEDICRVLFQRGAFTSVDTTNTASALAFYGLGLPGMATIRITVPVFYAHKDTRTPVLFSFLAVAVNLLLIYLLVGTLNFRGLALAVAAAATIQAAGLLVAVRLRFGGYRAARLGGFFIATAIIALTVVYALRRLIPQGADMAAAIYGLGAIFIAVLLYLLVTWLLKFRESRFLFGRWARSDKSDSEGIRF